MWQQTIQLLRSGLHKNIRYFAVQTFCQKDHKIRLKLQFLIFNCGQILIQILVSYIVDMELLRDMSFNNNIFNFFIAIYSRAVKTINIALAELELHYSHISQINILE